MKNMYEEKKQPGILRSLDWLTILIYIILLSPLHFFLKTVTLKCLLKIILGIKK